MRSDAPILRAENLKKQFHSTSSFTNKKTLTALDNVSLQLAQGESLGIAGESGCGKSTLGKILAGVLPADAGDVFFHETPFSSLSKVEYANFRRTTQMIFQDPFSSLNPRMRIGDSIAEPLLISGVNPQQRTVIVQKLMTTIGLSPEMAHRFPDEFSGGQRQRIGIARALAASPGILIADEPVSALDISIQAQIINLLQQMKSDFNLSMILISHNLSVVRHLCDRVIIMYLGSVVETAPAQSLFKKCCHPYTEALLAAIPAIGSNREHARAILTDDLPSPYAIPTGCRFHPRCRYAVPLCSEKTPDLIEMSEGHASACHLARQLYS